MLPTTTFLLLLTSLLPQTHATPTSPRHHLPRQATVNETSTGVYTCSLPSWSGGCTWEDTSGSPLCRMIPWTDSLTHSPQNGRLARVSIGPDAGNHCILYESARCDDSEPSYLLRDPGTEDLYEWAKGLGLDGQKKGLYSMLCLSEGLVGYYFKGGNQTQTR